MLILHILLFLRELADHGEDVVIVIVVVVGVGVGGWVQVGVGV